MLKATKEDIWRRVLLAAKGEVQRHPSPYGAFHNVLHAIANAFVDVREVTASYEAATADELEAATLDLERSLRAWLTHYDALRVRPWSDIDAASQVRGTVEQRGRAMWIESGKERRYWRDEAGRSVPYAERHLSQPDSSD